MQLLSVSLTSDMLLCIFFFSSRRRHTRYIGDWSSDVCSSDLTVSWLAAATAVGALIVLLPTRKKKMYVDLKSGRKANKTLIETGFALGALKIGASLIRPAKVELVKNRLTGVAGRPRKEGFTTRAIQKAKRNL